MTLQSCEPDSELERLYANGTKYSKDDEWTEVNIVRTSAAGLEMLLGMQPCFVYRLSVEALPHLCRRGPEHLPLVRDAIVELLASEIGRAHV